MEKTNTFWRHSVTRLFTMLLLICIGLSGCGRQKEGDTESVDNIAGTGTGNIQIVGDSKIVIKAEHEDGAYVAEPAMLTVPENANYLRSVTLGGRLWGTDADGRLWGTDKDGRLWGTDKDGRLWSLDVNGKAWSEEDETAAGFDGMEENPDDAALLEMLQARKAWDFSDVRSIFLWQDCVYVSRIAKEEELEIWSPAGERLGRIDGKGGSLETIGGGLYVLRRTGQIRSQVSICRIDIEKRELGEELSQLPYDVRGIFAQGSDAENLYFYTADAAYRYSYADQTFYQLFPWTDVGLLGGSIYMIWRDEQGDIYANSYEDPSYVRIRWKSEEELPKKNELTVAIVSMNSDGNLQKLVTEYNQSQDEWHVSIKTYASNDMSDLEDAKTRMSADLLSKNPPDMICHANLNRLSEDLAAQGYLADLRTFLQESTVLSEEDFYPEILKYGSCGDLLYTIPCQFWMETLIVPTSQWKGKPGWTYEEMIQYLRDHDEYRPFRMFLFFRMYCLYGDPLDYFWDAKKREAYFDGEEFRALLQYMKECQDKESQIPAEDRPFNVKQLDVHFLGSYPRERLELGDLVVMGYPSPDGTPRTTINGVTELSITATSKKQEGAWDFLEFCLSQDPVKPGYVAFGFWSNRNVNEKIIERELALCGKDHEDILDENGEVIGAMYSEHLVDQESVDAFREMLANARKAPSGNAQVQQIVGEETMAYFEGQKNLEQVIDAIQSRVKLFLAE
ncbi:MAG: extracellular solute-binding protein [Lachnospiraceae bacterium]|nr:extracellular solute-binding protein [Lachnospiraceae bacterium]